MGANAIHSEGEDEESRWNNVSKYRILNMQKKVFSSKVCIFLFSTLIVKNKYLWTNFYLL